MSVKYYWDSTEITFQEAKAKLRLAALERGYDPDEANAMLDAVNNAGSMSDTDEICESIFSLSDMHLEIDVE